MYKWWSMFEDISAMEKFSRYGEISIEAKRSGEGSYMVRLSREASWGGERWAKPWKRWRDLVSISGENISGGRNIRLSNKFHKQQEGRNSSFRVSKRRYDRKSQWIWGKSYRLLQAIVRPLAFTLNEIAATRAHESRTNMILTYIFRDYSDDELRKTYKGPRVETGRLLQ